MTSHQSYRSLSPDQYREYYYEVPQHIQWQADEKYKKQLEQEIREAEK